MIWDFCTDSFLIASDFLLNLSASGTNHIFFSFSFSPFSSFLPCSSAYYLSKFTFSEVSFVLNLP
jgi:hypothetical protein